MADHLFTFNFTAVPFTNEDIINFIFLNSGSLKITNWRGEEGQPQKFLVRATVLIFSSEPPWNPRPFNIIFLKCLILQDKTIFKESGHVRV